MSNLCQLSSVKSRLGLGEADVQDDELLGNFIALVSGIFAKECHREFARSATATYEFRGDDMDIPVDRFPVESVSKWELKSSETEGWVEQTDIVYLLNAPKSILELSIALGTSRQLGRVTFAGGYVLPGGTVGAGQTALPGELEQAAVEQVAFLYQNKDRLGLTSVTGEGGSISRQAMELLPFAAAVIKKYERWRP